MEFERFGWKTQRLDKQLSVMKKTLLNFSLRAEKKKKTRLF